jgi:2-polyprenyl-3-methyl-5-hydroxy-6-metoxy-1,4-benzoquinol methylase
MSTESWEERYSSAERLFSDRPSELLVTQRALLSPGMRALAIADGEGRNGVWLAEQGLIVDAVDLSATALTRARARAAEHGVSLTTTCADILEWAWTDAAYDVIVDIFLHLPRAERQGLHHRIRSALRPGGLMFLEGFHRDQLEMESGGPRDPDQLYTLEELREDFEGLEILQACIAPTEVERAGVFQGPGVCVQFVARRLPY